MFGHGSFLAGNIIVADTILLPCIYVCFLNSVANQWRIGTRFEDFVVVEVTVQVAGHLRVHSVGWQCHLLYETIVVWVEFFRICPLTLCLQIVECLIVHITADVVVGLCRISPYHGVTANQGVLLLVDSATDGCFVSGDGA